jgi:hypothetical protein
MVDWSEKTFNIDECTADVDEVKEKFVPGVGKIRYKRATISDVLAINAKGVKSQHEMGVHLLAVMLGKVDPAVTVEKVKKLDPQVAEAILRVIKG